MSTQPDPFEIMPDGRMDTASAAKYLKISRKTLATRRSRGTGPLFTKPGRVFYFKTDLDEFLARRKTSTAKTEPSA